MSRQAFQRKSKSRNQGPRILIGCEDSVSAQGYFKAIRKDLRLPSERVIVFSPPETDPLNVVRAVIARRNKEGLEEGDQSWAVFDGDEHLQSSLQNWNEAIQLAKGRGIHLAISNPSFELWYLLHYQDQFADLYRDHALQALKKHLPNYEKSDILYPTPLKPFTKEAIGRAQEIARRAQRNHLAEHANPCAERVAALVEILFQFPT